MSHATPAAPSPARFGPAAHVLATADAARTVLLDPRRGEYYTLDEVGGRVWTLLAGGATAAELADRLAEEYDAPLETLLADVSALLDGMAAAGLVERR
ncbi:MAG TPA: PqqD family protein [Longimicrobiaceae bacterium]